MIRFGNYSRRVQLISYLDVSDGFGGTIPTPTVEVNTFAAVKQLRGSNDLEAAQLELPKTYEFRIQQRSGLEPNTGMQIVYDDYIHVIKGITQSKERNFREYIITATRTDQEFTETAFQGIGFMIIGSTFTVS